MVQRTLNGDENMKALIFNGSKEGDDSLRTSLEAIETQLKEMGWQVDSLHLHEMDIALCLGCFGCWVKTPGICVINDSGRAIPKKIVQSDLMIFLTPITFGGYSPELKKALDRAIPMLLPFFKRVHGETHHVMRYEKYPKLVAIGALPKPDQESEALFKQLLTRNAINYSSPKKAAGILYANQSENEIRSIIEKLLNKVGVKA